MNSTNFNGPLFVIGMPRSGTKLLRDLLNQNSNIGIHPLESDFIPYLVKKFGLNFNFSPDINLLNFYHEFTKTGFFIEMINRGQKLEYANFSANANRATWSSIFEFIFRYYAPSNRSHNFIWGDKTPGYLNQLPILKSIFPDAKFLHIIRDPRDYSLSVCKAWNKNILRAAERWRHSIEKARFLGSNFPNDYHEIKYEELLINPAKELQKVCGFLKCDYNNNMESLMKPVEKLGDAKGASYILRSNSNKYLSDFSKVEIKRIEEIALPIMNTLNYSQHYGENYKPLNSIQKFIYHIQDGFAVILFYLKNETNVSRIFQIMNNYRKSSWRTF